MIDQILADLKSVNLRPVCMKVGSGVTICDPEQWKRNVRERISWAEKQKTPRALYDLAHLHTEVAIITGQTEWQDYREEATKLFQEQRKAGLVVPLANKGPRVV